MGFALVCARVCIKTPKTPSLPFSAHSFVFSVQDCHEKELSILQLQQDIRCKIEPNFLYQNMQKKPALCIDDGPQMTLKEEGWGGIVRVLGGFLFCIVLTLPLASRVSGSS